MPDALCPNKFDGLWLGAGIDGEESSQAGVQVTLRAAQEKAVSTGCQGEYHSRRS
jgi:hypothetical protein